MIFSCILFNEKVKISVKISLKFVSNKGPIQNTTALVLAKAWHQTDSRLLPVPMLTKIYDELTGCTITVQTWSSNDDFIDAFKNPGSLFFFFFYISFIWHIQTRGTFSYIQHISTYIQTISYTYISINIYTYDSQPVTHSFIFVLTNMVHIHNFLDQYPNCVWYIRPVIEYSVLP